MNRTIKVVETNRKIENAETGLDIVVPDFVISKPQDTLKSAKAKYHIIITTDLRCKTDETTEENRKNRVGNTAVHYSIDKEFNDFLKLKSDLDKKHSGVYVPKIEISDKYSNKLAFASKPNWKECREKQVAVDKFMGWCARTPKVAASPILINFLGLNKLKLNKDEEKPITNEEEKPKKRQKVYEVEDLFDEIDFTQDQKDDLFGESGDDATLLDDADEKVEARFSTESKAEKMKKANLFKADDLIGNVAKDDKKLIILNEENDNKALSDFQDREKESNLLEVNEDISDVASKLQKVGIRTKPALKPKPSLKPKPAPRASKRNPSSSASLSLEKMEQNDLLNYIKENTERDDDLDLGF